jgi:DNA-binding IclR family transcriptional regulator
MGVKENEVLEKLAVGAGRGPNIPALRRTVQILDLVAAARVAPTGAELARLLGVPKSTAHGLCATMLELGLLNRSEAGTFRLGPHLMRWADGFLAQSDLVGEFHRLLAETGDLADFTVTLTVLDGNDVLYLACRNAKAPLGFTFRTGMRLPAPFTATGKSMLGTFSDAELRQKFAGTWPSPLSARSIASVEALLDEIHQSRARGYSVDDGQIREGMYCVGAPVRDHVGQLVAGLAVSLLANEATGERIAASGQQLRRTADSLSRWLGSR